VGCFRVEAVVGLRVDDDNRPRRVMIDGGRVGSSPSGFVLAGTIEFARDSIAPAMVSRWPVTAAELRNAAISDRLSLIRTVVTAVSLPCG
jgi:hypothetical protein